MPSKSVLKRGFKAEAERISEKYRAELSISKLDPLDAFVLAEHFKIQVFSVKDAYVGNEDHPDFSLLNNTDKFSAMWMPVAGGEKIIIHNDNHSEHRQQSNIMHELSHIVLGHEIPSETASLCYQFDLHYYNPLHEEEAKFLGGCLQITRAGLLWAIKSMNEHEISDYYNASIDMVRFRLNTTGVLKQLSYMQPKK